MLPRADQYLVWPGRIWPLPVSHTPKYQGTLAPRFFPLTHIVHPQGKQAVSNEWASEKWGPYVPGPIKSGTESKGIRRGKQNFLNENITTNSLKKEEEKRKKESITTNSLNMFLTIL